ncbi:alpha/beta hydrolase [Chryseobacterium sp. pc1-10]|uniref:Alpha/beta hydrolase n=1 Tax=Chryseobacterium herbae TaxID=2976476 RepID=A0ABT2IR46_9FLAO|nr:alpha/beta hydrolase [Chryseobacterium sp. pc1-10]
MTLLIQGQSLKNGHYSEKIDGLMISYLIKGSGPVMLVGNPNSGKTGYELSLQPLEKHFTMVYYDSRGTGESETPDHLSDYNSDNMVAEMENLRKKLNTDKIWIFGHSDQSALALLYALKYQNHIVGMILTGTSFVKSTEDLQKRRKKSEEKRINESPWFAQVVKDWDYMEIHKTNTSQDGRDLSAAKTKWWCYNEESSQKVIPISNAVSKAGKRRPIRGKNYYSPTDLDKYVKMQTFFSNIKTKTLIINGKYDTNNPPEYAEQLHQLLPNSTFILIEKAGHFPWAEDPEITFKAIEKWLQNLPERKKLSLIK